MSFLKRIFPAFFPAPFSEIVKEYYESWTPRYIQTFGDTFQSFRTTDMAQLFNQFIESSGMHDGQRILDAGCGVCGPAIYFASRLNVQIDALTISDLQKKVSEERIGNAASSLKGAIRVTSGDFHRLDKYYPQNSFDLIYFLESLTHSTDIPAVLAGCKKVLKKGGSVYIKDLYHGKSEDKETQRKIDVAVANVNREFALKVEKIEVFLEMLQQSGFRVDFCRQLQIMPDYSIGNKFVAENNIVIFENQTGPYDGIGLTYLDYYETKLTRV